MSPSTGGGLFAQTRFLVAFQCKLCPWGNLFPSEDDLTLDEIRLWFACPVHGTEQTEMNRIGLRDFRGRVKGVK